jgi:hypothetical protein
VRDSEGHGVLAGSGRLVTVNDALSAEGEACVAALQVCMNVGILQVIIETVSTNLVTALQSSSFDQALGGVIFREARALLAVHFTLRGIVFVPRSCNKCAHELTHSSLTRPGESKYLE